ncbi:hypothetical protein CF327_g4654 [Tilletia walkeri]|nr:hypothetical protein CF327_g4654 [Tilletia walkeri]
MACLGRKVLAQQGLQGPLRSGDTWDGARSSRAGEEQCLITSLDLTSFPPGSSQLSAVANRALPLIDSSRL